MIVPAGGLSADGGRRIAGRPDYLLPVPVLPRLFRGLVLSMLLEAHAEGRLKFHGSLTDFADKKAFKALLAPLWRCEWVVYANEPFAGPEAVLVRLTGRSQSEDKLLALASSPIFAVHHDPAFVHRHEANI
jgi:Putative transposase